MEEVSTCRERIDFLTTNYDLSEKNAKALILTELGYSHSGIAKRLDVTSDTAKKYLRQLESEIGEYVTQTLPKPVRYPTFPGDTPKSEVKYAGDYVDYEPEFSQRELPLNKGVPLSEIPTELISLNLDIEVEG